MKNLHLGLDRSELLSSLNCIDGKWQPALSGETFEVYNPATSEVIATVPNSQLEDARAAADAANRAFSDWREKLPRERAAILHKWHDAIVKNGDDLARLISLEQGKPFFEARGEVAYGASYVAWFAEEASRIYGDIIPPQQRGKRMTTLKEPIGVVAAITPWNFPLAMLARKIAPALAAGCTVIAKPAEDTPLTALALVRLAQEVGVPAGVVNIVTTSRNHVATTVSAWLSDDRVRKISFTGSTAVGKFLARESAGTLKRLSMELGGNAPFIVFDDADVEAAVSGLVSAKFRNGGQTCVCPNRVYVQSGVYERFADLLSVRVASLRVGPATDVTAQIGPMINSRAVEKIVDHVSDALTKGASALIGGNRLPEVGPNYFAPTVLVNASANMLLVREETFGPVAALFRFDTEDEVINAANHTPFGLAAYFYSQDIRRIERVSRMLDAGILGVNEGAISSEVAPFGGVKESGYGREGSRYGLDDYTTLKYVCQGGLL